MGNKFCEGFGRSLGIQINLRITKKLCTDELDIKLSFYILEIRDVSTGATCATGVAPKFSDTLTLFQTAWRWHQKFPQGFSSAD